MLWHFYPALSQFPFSLLALEVPEYILGKALAAEPPVGTFFSFQVQKQSREIMQHATAELAKSDRLCPQPAPGMSFLLTYLRERTEGTD